MKTVGIIAEFNPFHNGHKYIIEQAKEKSGADKVIIVMSGAFTQRGTPSYMYKYDRVRCALMSGADLVLELPVSYSTATAEVFAFGGVSILNSLGVTDFLCFGSESGDTDLLTKAAGDIISPDESHLKIIKEALSQGASYPAARSKAYPEYETVLNKPNNILAIEYIKALYALSSSIIPIAVTRVGSDYHDTDISEMASAEGIRNLFSPKDSSCMHSGETSMDALRLSVPEQVYDIYMSVQNKTWPIELNDYSSLIYSSLLLSDKEELSGFQDMNTDIANKFKNALPRFTDADGYIAELKSKELTYSRINRALIHCLFRQRDYTRDSESRLLPCPYTRILGFRKESSDLLHNIQKATDIPVITKSGDANKLLPPEAMPHFNRTVLADRLYDHVLFQKYGTRLNDGCLISPVIL